MSYQMQLACTMIYIYKKAKAINLAIGLNYVFPIDYNVMRYRSAYCECMQDPVVHLFNRSGFIIATCKCACMAYM